MTRIGEINFFLKLALATAIMVLAWISPDWRYGVPLSLAVLAAMAAVRVPNLAGYLKGAGLLVCLVVASWLVNLLLQGHSLFAALPVAVAMAARLVTTTAAFFFVMETSSPGSILAAASAARLPPVATLVLALTFGIIPMLRDDFERIADAQRARGMEVDDVGLSPSCASRSPGAFRFSFRRCAWHTRSPSPWRSTASRRGASGRHGGRSA